MRLKNATFSNFFIFYCNHDFHLCSDKQFIDKWYFIRSLKLCLWFKSFSTKSFMWSLCSTCLISRDLLKFIFHVQTIIQFSAHTVSLYILNKIKLLRYSTKILIWKNSFCNFYFIFIIWKISFQCRYCFLVSSHSSHLKMNVRRIIM